MVETYLPEAREGELFVHVFVDIIDLEGECQQIHVKMIVHVLFARTRLTQVRDFGFLPETKEVLKVLTFGFKLFGL